MDDSTSNLQHETKLHRIASDNVHFERCVNFMVEMLEKYASTIKIDSLDSDKKGAPNGASFSCVFLFCAV